jgi:electron-transferring-flavoprotein dehydrogenase
MGNFVGSLSELVGWLGRRAADLGVELYSGFAGSEVLYEGNRVAGVATNDVGVAKDGSMKANFERGMALKAKYTLFAEGAHGSLSKAVIAKHRLRQPGVHQTYGLGLKEVWQVRPEVFRHGHIAHSVGWPLDYQTYGGMFMYHYGDNLVSIGLVVGLNYTNPYLNLYKEFQRLKTHPTINEVLSGGTCIAYGARALNSGGLQSVPKLVFPGGALIGCSAGFVNVPKIKGTHTAMKTGMLAAEAVEAALSSDSSPDELDTYQQAYEASWVHDELHRVRNCKPAFHNPFGVYGGLLWSGIELALRGKTPWTLRHGAPDYACTKPAKESHEIVYPKADGALTFDLLESVSRTGTNHEEDQPVHLRLSDPSVPVKRNLPVFAGLESRFCPAGVYEYTQDDSGSTKFQINAQNCIHCKTCDIKDPSQNINWTVPEGGGGPKYSNT